MSTVFATRVEERNLIYIAPLLFIGTALVFSRRRVSTVGLAVTGAYTLYLVGYALYHVTQYPYQMGVQLYSDALGFAIVQQGNRDLSWTPHLVREVLIVMSVVSVLVLLAPALSREAARAVAAVVTAAARGRRPRLEPDRRARGLGRNELDSAPGSETLGHPFSWVDDITHGASRRCTWARPEVDQNPEWLLEFWNRSLARNLEPRRQASSAPALPGSPNILRNGALYWSELAGTPFSIQYPVRG